MRGLALYGHVNEDATRFAVIDDLQLTINVYSYGPKKVTYLYSFGNVSPSSELGGAAYNPRSKE